MSNVRRDVDWQAIKNAYRCAAPGIRMLAEIHGVSEGTIHARARREGWTRDVAATVRKSVKKWGLSPRAAAVLSRRPMVALQREDIAECTALWRSWGEQRAYSDIDGNMRLSGGMRQSVIVLDAAHAQGRVEHAKRRPFRRRSVAGCMAGFPRGQRRRKAKPGRSQPEWRAFSAGLPSAALARNRNVAMHSATPAGVGLGSQPEILTWSISRRLNLRNRTHKEGAGRRR